MDTKTSLQILEQIITQALANAQTEHELEAVRLQHLTRSSELSNRLASIKDMSSEDKKVYGPLFNETRQRVYELYEQAQKRVRELEHSRAQEHKSLFDVTAYKPNQLKGSLHPYTRTIQKIEDVMISMGYTIVDGPELEHEEKNFDALNFPPNHPARDMQDTVWLELPGMLMRTHTSNVQIHTMRSQQPPIAMITSGRAYRYEATDASHDYVFGQTEGLFVDKKASLSNLLATMQELLAGIFDRHNLKIKVQPTYYPFVEPGIDIHMECVFCQNGCPTCKHTRWIEIAGAGIVHPNVLRACNIDPEVYRGFAFGFGLTRLTMLKYGINDIRHLHGGNLDFLEQF